MNAAILSLDGRSCPGSEAINARKLQYAGANQADGQNSSDMTHFDEKFQRLGSKDQCLAMRVFHNKQRRWFEMGRNHA